jgi:serine/threonine protein kinase
MSDSSSRLDGVPECVAGWLSRQELTVKQLCGTGGYGRVWLVETKDGTRKCLKVIDKTSLGGAWEREKRGVQTLRKSLGAVTNLVYVEDDVDFEDTYCYLMEAADDIGGADGYKPDTLYSRLQDNRLDSIQLKTLVLALLDGLEALHGKRLVHRDLKPDNVVFVKGIPKIADFGTVTPHILRQSYTGTEGFRPSWVEMGGSVDYGMKWDLYSLGKLAYISATGMLRDREDSWMYDVKHLVFGSDQLSDPLMQSLNAFLLEACSENPEECFGSCRNFRKSFLRIFESEVAGMRKDLPWVLGSGLVVVLLLLVIVWHGGSFRGSSASDVKLPRGWDFSQCESIDRVTRLSSLSRSAVPWYEYGSLQPEDWRVWDTVGSGLTLHGQRGVYWRLDPSTVEQRGDGITSYPKDQHSLSLMLAKRALPSKFEIAWRCFGHNARCTQSVLLLGDGNVSSLEGVVPKWKGTIEMNGGEILLVDGAKQADSCKPMQLEAVRDENLHSFFVMTNRLVKDGDTVTWYVDGQVPRSASLNGYDGPLFVALVYSSHENGLIAVKDFVVFSE